MSPIVAASAGTCESFGKALKQAGGIPAEMGEE
jgi:hypothetical protein